MPEGLAARYQQTLERIDQAARTSGRVGTDIKLVIVTKHHPASVIAELAELGAQDFGENRVDEALFKQQIMKDQQDIHWHMIGHVQSRKAAEVCANFSLVHSLDSLKLARRMESRAATLELSVPVLLQFNVSGEDSKFGWQAHTPEAWPQLLPDIEAVLKCTNLSVRGLMTMAPYSISPKDARPHFARLRELRDFLAERFPDSDWRQLSMGMSGDYEVGIQEGATIVRIGTAILSDR